MKPFFLTATTRRCSIIVVLALGMVYCRTAKATHAAGADFTYRCLGGLTYELTISFYRDCGGVAEPASIDITYRTLTGLYTTTRTAVALKDASSGQEITTACAGTSTKCNGGIYTGIRQWKYKATVTLPDTASDWIFSYSICCRNCSITTITAPCTNGVSNLYVEATLNNAVAGCNNSPSFSNIPMAFAYVGQNFNYNHGVIDIDGDSLVYSIITPRFSYSTYVTFIPPHNTLNPVLSSTPFTVNSVSGDINFTPSQAEVGILTILVREYRNGIMIGSVIRDMQIYTTISTNNLPALTGINGTADYSITTCPGSPVCFTIYSEDADSLQDLTLSANNGIAGATYVITGSGRPQMQFCWTPQMSDADGSPHVFTVTVKDNACGLNASQVFSYSIYVAPPEYNINKKDVSCKGMNDGFIGLQGANCSFLWNTGDTSASIDSLAPGTYTCTVTNTLSGCTKTDSIIVEEPDGIEFSSVVNDALCSNMCNGSISIVTNDSLCTFQWNNGSVVQNISGLCSGAYTLTIYENNACRQTITFFVSEKSTPSVNAIITNLDCPVMQYGSIDLQVSGGTGPYIYYWNTGDSTEDLFMLSPGSYSVTVADSLGCTVAYNTQITTEQHLTVDSVVSPISCYGLSDGTVSLQVSGGMPPYSYLWSNGASSSGISSLTAGNYSVTISEANGCTSQALFQITEPEPLALNALVNHLQCSNSYSGAITLSVSGGVSPYTINWQTGAITASLAGVNGGSYAVTVTDDNQCVVRDTIMVKEPAAITVYSTLKSIDCNGNANGSIDLNISGGKIPYSFQWSNGKTSEDIQGLEAGVYSVTVTDSIGCSVLQTFQLHEPQPLECIFNITDVLCRDEITGKVETFIAGGSPPYDISWSNGAVTETITGLVAGNYVLTVQDVNGCIRADSVSVSQPATAISISTTKINIACKGHSSGSATIYATGGTGSYTYQWSNGGTSATVTGLAAGIYTATVMDANGCSRDVSISIEEPAMSLSVDAVISNITCIHPFGAIALNLSGGSGDYTVYWADGTSGPYIEVTGAGSTGVLIADEAGCLIDTTFSIIDETNNIAIDAVSTAPSCLSGITGSIVVHASGGTEPYQYIWNDSATGPSLANLHAGSYGVSVTDAQGCTASKTILLEDHSQVKLNLTGTIELCAGSMVDLFTEPVDHTTYQWNYNGIPLTGTDTNAFSTPAAGTYTVTAVSSCGIFESNSVEIVLHAAQAVSISNDVIICEGEQASLKVTGGISYEWRPAEGLDATNIADPLASPDKTTRYTVTITDDAGCKTSASVLVTVLCDTLDIPNGYSPNGDGVNDEFVIEGLNSFPENTLFIYNRWGNLVYKKKNYHNEWNGISNINGTFAGKVVPDGTYYYILDLHNNGKPVCGFLVLKR